MSKTMVFLAMNNKSSTLIFGTKSHIDRFRLCTLACLHKLFKSINRVMDIHVELASQFVFLMQNSQKICIFFIFLRLIIHIFTHILFLRFVLPIILRKFPIFTRINIPIFDQCSLRRIIIL